MVRDLCIHGPRQKMVPTVLMVVAVLLQATPYFLDLAFSLTISLRVIARGQTHRDSEKLEEGFPHVM